MKLRWITGILTVGMLALSAMAQADHPQLPDVGGATATEPSPASAVVPDSMPQPQNSLNAYEQQMASVTVQTYTELTQISEALHSGRSFGSCIGRMLPFIAGPAQRKWRVHLDAAAVPGSRRPCEPDD